MSSRLSPSRKSIATGMVGRTASAVRFSCGFQWPGRGGHVCQRASLAPPRLRSGPFGTPRTMRSSKCVQLCRPLTLLFSRHFIFRTLFRGSRRPSRPHLHLLPQAHSQRSQLLRLRPLPPLPAQPRRRRHSISTRTCSHSVACRQAKMVSLTWPLSPSHLRQLTTDFRPLPLPSP